jgi:20S proteasome alpha/beta subunit
MALIYDYIKFQGNPLWNQLLIAGFRGAAPFLGYVDLIGTAYEENFIATGLFCCALCHSLT